MIEHRHPQEIRQAIDTLIELRGLSQWRWTHDRNAIEMTQDDKQKWPLYLTVLSFVNANTREKLGMFYRSLTGTWPDDYEGLYWLEKKDRRVIAMRRHRVNHPRTSFLTRIYVSGFAKCGLQDSIIQLGAKEVTRGASINSIQRA